MIDVKNFSNYRLNFVKECNLIVYSESCGTEWEDHARSIEKLRGGRIKVILLNKTSADKVAILLC